MYALIHENRLILGPMNFNIRYFNSELEDLGINYRVSSDTPSQVPFHINDETHIPPVREEVPDHDPRFFKTLSFSWEIIKDESNIPIEMLLTHTITEKTLDEVKNEIILCGSFHDNIIFDNGQTLLGTGESSVFAGIFDMGTGKVKNLRAFSGNNSVNQAYALSLHVWGNALVIAGNFDRDIVVDSITEMALSRDWDIFLIYLKRIS